VLDELTLAVLEERDVPRLLDLVARRLRELIGARRVLVSVPDPSGGFRVVATAAEGVADLIGYGVPSESKSTRVLARGKSERTDSVLEDLEVDQASARPVSGLAALFISSSLTRRRSASFPPMTRTVPVPASPTMALSLCTIGHSLPPRLAARGVAHERTPTAPIAGNGPMSRV
jgi:hypothetical protein